MQFTPNGGILAFCSNFYPSFVDDPIQDSTNHSIALFITNCSLLQGGFETTFTTFGIYPIKTELEHVLDAADYSPKNLSIYVLENLSVNNTIVDKFELMPHLKTLNIQKSIIGLRPELFQNVTNLRYLRLHNNNIWYIPHHIFEPLKKLRYLNLANNGISRLTGDQVAGLIKLKYLSLAHNQISELSITVFQNLRDVEEVDLSFNKIIIVPKYLFGYPYNFKSLDLSGNSISLTDGLFLPNEIKTLNFSNCQLSDLSSMETNTNYMLSTVDFSHNNLEYDDLKIIVYNKAEFRVIDFSHNRISYIDVSKIFLCFSKYIKSFFFSQYC